MTEHITVLLHEAIEALNIKPEGIYVDATLGGAGHSLEIVKKLTTGRLYCFEQDETARVIAKERLKGYENNYHIIETNFVNLKHALATLGVTKIDGILYDIGVSSFQFDTPERGFSYRFDAPLDMRMDNSQPNSAYDIINEASYHELVKLFYTYGEDPFSKQIARAIEKKRLDGPIKTTFELVDVIKSALPQKVLKAKGHPAKQVFQALRIAVNDELNVFEQSLKQAIDLLHVDGRVVVITFHSLEDRIAKQVFKEHSEVYIPKGLPIQSTEKPLLELITKKPILPSSEELEHNNRAHSAKMRVARKNKEK